MVAMPARGTWRQKRQRYGWDFSSSVGLAMGMTRESRASMASVRRRMAPPLPEASQPSKTQTMERRAWEAVRTIKDLEPQILKELDAASQKLRSNAANAFDSLRA